MLSSGGSAPDFMLLAAGDGAVEEVMRATHIAHVLTLIQPPLPRGKTPKKRLPEPLRFIANARPVDGKGGKSSPAPASVTLAAHAA